MSARENAFVDESHISTREARRRRGWSQADERLWVRSTLGGYSEVTSMAMYGVMSVYTLNIVDGDFLHFVLETDILPLDK
eukprot:CAMPEP_0185020982 /NCGR_PEP_ID=MMETSP1103-20130426/3639_1 /TAXON_ID=36769 /ORGANISM="Paraphysomonas bandaiensis, Strain Caron Lab Isolate" /LENGTH=79 /DNA_ID=CAMNT_0027552237 /DNA_START=379 /DNA_END=618 /DNA_ORIENTATION=-